MPSCFQVIQGIKDQVKASEPFDIELGIFYIGMICCKLDFRVELLRSFLCDYRFWFLDMFMTKQKLTVEVR